MSFLVILSPTLISTIILIEYIEHDFNYDFN
jgi:hypothetical protein